MLTCLVPTHTLNPCHSERASTEESAPPKARRYTKLLTAASPRKSSEKRRISRLVKPPSAVSCQQHAPGYIRVSNCSCGTARQSRNCNVYSHAHLSGAHPYSQ